MKGLFITFEGLEGAGKSVQVGILASKLREMGYEIIATREPGGTRIGELIRGLTHDPQNVDLTAVSESYLMAAARAQHVREIIKPARSSGKIVVCDRYLDSSIAYQGYGRALGEKIIIDLNALAVDGVLPDVTFYLDIPWEVGRARRNGTKKIDRLDLQQADFYKRVQEGYVTLIKNNTSRIKSIDATLSLPEVAQRVWDQVQPLLPKKP